MSAPATTQGRWKGIPAPQQSKAVVTKQSRTRLRMLLLLGLVCGGVFAYAKTSSFISPRSWHRARSRQLLGFANVGSHAWRRSLSTPALLQDGTCPTDYRLDEALAVCSALDHHWNVTSVDDLVGHANENGAYSKHNQKYDATKEGRWYIEEQYYGFMFVQAGLAFDNPRAVDLGLKIFDWGFQQQQANGSFSCPDSYHSSGFFMEAVARAALLLRYSYMGKQYKRWIQKSEKHLARLADWFLSPAVEKEAWRKEAPHTHRRYLTGTGLGLIGRLTRNQTLVDISWRYIEDGLRKQDPSGFNNERGGYDCSYQGIGLVYSARYFLYVADTDARRAQMLDMGKRGVEWLVSRVHEDGSLNTTGNTRTGLKQEKGRNGKPKALAKREIVQGLLYWGWILGDDEVVNAAWLVEEERTGSIHRPCSCQLDAEGKWLMKNVMRCEMGLCSAGIKVTSMDRASFARRYRAALTSK